ncbi:MAG: hypothetical protein MI673_06025, partial [Thiotrichales bacterium]|nr:hypothetical protein [Thiotrichales bacterium]
MTQSIARPGGLILGLLLVLSGPLSAGPLEENAKQIQKLAEQGDAKAQSHLGYLHYVGEGVPQDYAKAVSWYRKAATQGDRDAQYNLAVAYAFGEGIAQDLKQASIWYRRAAQQGHVISQYSLGLSYAYGEGVPQDSAAAVRWFTKAAEQGYIRAQVQLGSAYHTGEGVDQDYSQAIKWYRMAADRGDATAQYNLGALYRSGKGVEQNYQQAIRWFTMAADQGYAAAQNELASLQRTSGQVATRPTPHLRPGSDKAAPGIDTSVPATSSVAAATETTSPISTRTGPEAEDTTLAAAADTTADESVAIAQTPQALSETGSADSITPPADKTADDSAETEKTSGGLFEAIGRMLATKPDTETTTVEAEPGPGPVAASEEMDTATETTAPATVTRAESRTGQTIPTTIHKETTVTAEDVEIISNVPETDAVVRSVQHEETGETATADPAEAPVIKEIATIDTTDEDAPGFFERFFGSSAQTDETNTDQELAEDTGIEDVADTPVDIATATVTEEDVMADKTPVTAAAESDPATGGSEDESLALAEPDTTVTEDEPGESGGIGGFFSSIFGSSETADSTAQDQIALAEDPSVVEPAAGAGDDIDVTQEFSISAGRSALEQGRYDEAIRQFQPLAEHGDPEAQSHLASMYYVGRSVQKNYQQAFDWYQRAAEQGHIDSQYSIGNMYLLGEGVQQDNQLAAQWYNKAAQQGHVAASHNLLSLKRLMEQTGEPLDLSMSVEIAAAEPADIPVPEADAVTTPGTQSLTLTEELDVRETEAETDATVAVTSNMPQTDQYLRNTTGEEPVEPEPLASIEEDTTDEARVSDATADATSTDTGSGEDSGLGGFFSRLFGSPDDSSEEAVAATDGSPITEEPVEITEPEPEGVSGENVTQAETTGITDDSSVVRAFGIASAPVSQQLTDVEETETPEPHDSAMQPPAETAQTEPEPEVIALSEAADETDIDISGEPVEEDPSVTTAEPEGPGFFERLFGPAAGNPGEETGVSSAIDSDGTPALPETPSVDEQPEYEPEPEPVVEATLMAETESDSDDGESELQDPGPNVEQDTDEEPGFFARLF